MVGAGVACLSPAGRRLPLELRGTSRILPLGSRGPRLSAFPRTLFVACRTFYAAGMDPDDQVCLCFHVSLRKIANFIVREEPRVASQISECLGAGTGCQWCVPFLKKLHRLHLEGKPLDLPVSPEEYASRRQRYRKTGAREPDGLNGVDGHRDDGADDSVTRPRLD